MPSAADDKSRGTRGARRRSDRKAGRQRHEAQCRRPTRRLRRITGVIGHGVERRASPAAPRGASPPRVVPATRLVRAASISRTWWLLAASFFLSLGTLSPTQIPSQGHPTNPGKEDGSCEEPQPSRRRQAEHSHAHALAACGARGGGCRGEGGDRAREHTPFFRGDGADTSWSSNRCGASALLPRSRDCGASALLPRSRDCGAPCSLDLGTTMF